MAMVFQGYALWPHMTVAQNVAFGLEMRRLGREEIRRQMDWVLGVVNLRGMEQRYPHELSGGQQQRVALARALVVRPGTLLLDEPLSNLDANLREQMRFEIRRVHQETGITMVYVTHDQAEALVIADRIAVMNVGQIEQIGSPREIYEQPQSRFAATFIGQANCLAARAIAAGVVAVDGVHFAVANGLAAAVGDDVTLAIRPSAVRIIADGTDAPVSNVIRGRLIGQAYLGDQQDLRLEVSGGNTVRALAPSHLLFPAGAETLLHFPPQDCRVVRN
jgi:iron(III) transport system ATP-binding protein